MGESIPLGVSDLLVACLLLASLIVDLAAFRRTALALAAIAYSVLIVYWIVFFEFSLYGLFGGNNPEHVIVETFFRCVIGVAMLCVTFWEPAFRKWGRASRN